MRKLILKSGTKVEITDEEAERVVKSINVWAGEFGKLPEGIFMTLKNEKENRTLLIQATEIAVVL